MAPGFGSSPEALDREFFADYTRLSNLCKIGQFSGHQKNQFERLGPPWTALGGPWRLPGTSLKPPWSSFGASLIVPPPAIEKTMEKCVFYALGLKKSPKRHLFDENVANMTPLLETLADYTFEHLTDDIEGFELSTAGGHRVQGNTENPVPQH